MKKKILKNYHFLIDNYMNGRNKQIQFVVDDFSKKSALKQIKNLFGEVVLNQIIFDFQQEACFQN